MKGKVFHQTLSFFRDYEDATEKKIIGDEFESVRIYRPVKGLQINDLTHGKSFSLEMGFESSVRAGEIYIFCFSHVLTDELIREFRAKAYVKICKPAAFIKRWQSALPQNAKPFARKVEYYQPENVPGNVWPQPDLISTTKLSRFAYQKEYRLGFSTTGALDFGQATQQLVDRKARPEPQVDEHHNLTLDLGGLGDVCELCTCDS